MPQDLEQAVTAHYARPDLPKIIADALAAAGLAGGRLRPLDLAPLDEFHVGGRSATAYCVARMALRPDARVLDVGCGLGGAARYIAAEVGAHVTGIDLTPEYIEVARMLADRTGLSERVDFHVASALDMPFAAASFDAAVTLHAAMNIADRAGLYREIARVLKPGALLCLYDVMLGGAAADVRYPVPWAESAATSHLVSVGDMRALLTKAGFTVEATEDRSAAALAYFRERPASAAGPLGTHLLMGANAREKALNVRANIESGAIAPVVVLARRAA